MTTSPIAKAQDSRDGATVPSQPPLLQYFVSECGDVSYFPWSASPDVTTGFLLGLVVPQIAVVEDRPAITFTRQKKSEVSATLSRPGQFAERMRQVEKILRQCLWLIRAGVCVGQDDSAVEVRELSNTGSLEPVLRCFIEPVGSTEYPLRLSSLVREVSPNSATRPGAISGRVQRWAKAGGAFLWRTWRFGVMHICSSESRAAADALESVVKEMCDLLREAPTIRAHSVGISGAVYACHSAYNGIRPGRMGVMGWWGLRWLLPAETQYLLALERRINAVLQKAAQ